MMIKSVRKPEFLNVGADSHENQQEKHHGSVDKYRGSPYLQRLEGSLLKKKNNQSSRFGNRSPLGKGYEAGESQAGKQSPFKSNSNHKYLMPGVSGSRKHNFNAIKLPHLEDQEANLVDKQKLTVASHSATLQLQAKKHKLMPIHRQQFQAVYKTKAGTNGNQTKVNQDVAILDTKLPLGLKLYSVCDGHGLNGHLVSAFIKTHLIKNLNKLLKKQLHTLSDENIQELLHHALQSTNDSLLDCEINTELSGSTVVAVFIYEDKIFCFNIGDSRAILVSEREGPGNYKSENMSEAKKARKFEWVVKELSIDQKPERQDEKDRILARGGRVDHQRNQKGEQIGPLRVWMKDIQMPGLAMTRSFGDKAGIKAGTNGDPEVIHHQLHNADKFIVVASDGVWEYLENEEVVDLIIPYYLKGELEMAAEKVVKVSSETWARISFSRDDITVIIVAIG